MALGKVKTRNALLAGLCALCALSLFGVGFASWNIISNETKDGSGQIKTDADAEFVKSMGDYIAIENTANPVLGRYFFEPDSGTQTTETSTLSFRFDLNPGKMPSFLSGSAWFDLRCTFGVYDNEKSAYIPLLYNPTSRDLSTGKYAMLPSEGVAWNGRGKDAPSYDDSGEFAYFGLSFATDAGSSTYSYTLSLTLNNDLVLGVNNSLLNGHSIENLRYRLRFSFGGSGQ